MEGIWRCCGGGLVGIVFSSGLVRIGELDPGTRKALSDICGALTVPTWHQHLTIIWIAIEPETWALNDVQRKEQYYTYLTTAANPHDNSGIANDTSSSPPDKGCGKCADKE